MDWEEVLSDLVVSVSGFRKKTSSKKKGTDTWI